MLTIFLIILIVVLIGLLGYMTGLNIRNVNIAEFWFQEWRKSENDMNAWQQGRDEETEAYEQQYLSFMETIQNQSNAIDSYIEDLHFLVKLGEKHFDHCLPDFADEFKERFTKIRESVLLSEG